MAFGIGSENSSNIQSYSLLALLWRRVTVRLALVIGAVLFLSVVAIDSFHQAVAADMSHPVSERFQISAMAVEQQLSMEIEGHGAIAQPPETTWEFDAQVAHRLRHSDLTRASLTRSHLTRSHLFAPHL